METSIIIAIIFCATSVLAYFIKILFNSKCTDLDCFCVKIKRDVSRESRQASPMPMPMPIPFSSNLDHAIKHITSAPTKLQVSQRKEEETKEAEELPI